MRRTAEIFVLVLVMLALAWAVRQVLLPVRDGDQRRWLARNGLYRMGSDIAIFYEHSDPKETEFIREIHSLDELWSQLRVRKVLGQPVVASPLNKGYLTDAWHRPYQLEIRTRDNQTVIRITSSGANGVFENGQGDDLYVEITVDGKDVQMQTKE
jgi:hypothetical protein